MTNEHRKFWDAKHLEELAKINRPSVFVRQALKFFPSGANVLDLGAGSGQDTRYLLAHGFSVTAADFSKAALDLNWKTTPSQLKEKLTIKELDLTQPLPFTDQSFDVVYAHLVIHYFNGVTTRQIFDEIYRILRPEGLLALAVNSITDPEYGQGTQLENDYFEFESGRPKRYFSVESLREFTGNFQPIILDNKGSDPRRSHKTGLIRFVGRKI